MFNWLMKWIEDQRRGYEEMKADAAADDKADRRMYLAGAIDALTNLETDVKAYDLAYALTMSWFIGNRHIHTAEEAAQLVFDEVLTLEELREAAFGLCAGNMSWGEYRGPRYTFDMLCRAEAIVRRARGEKVLLE